LCPWLYLACADDALFARSHNKYTHCLQAEEVAHLQSQLSAAQEALAQAHAQLEAAGAREAEQAKEADMVGMVSPLQARKEAYVKEAE
jgi:hypothetical protein